MLQEYLRQARHVLVQIYRGQQIKFKLLACFHIKIIVRVDEAENIWHALYKHSIFFGQPQYVCGFSNFSLILCLQCA